MTGVHRAARSRRRQGFALWLALVVLAASAMPSFAQERSTLVRVLEEAHDFRARVRAALALGSSGDASMADALVRALGHDDNAAVRAAAAEGLGRLAAPTSRSALEHATHDSSESVREAATRALRMFGSTAPAPAAPLPSTPGRIDWPHVSYVVFVGSLSDRSDFAHARLVTVLGTEVRRSLGSLPNVAVIGASDSRAEADRETASRHIPSYRLEGSISRILRETSGHDLRVRCEVALVLMDDATRAIRASLNGAATGSEPAPTTAARPARERFLAEQATTSATRSAMSGATRAITGSH